MSGDDPVAKVRKFENRQFRTIDLEDGWQVVVGRNATDNDELSLEKSEPEDLWFHVDGMPGSHALLLHRPGLQPPTAVVEKAAAIAAWYSKGRGSPRVGVGMTQAAFVSKRRDQPPGEVMVKRQRLLKVVPELPDTPDARGT